MLPVAVDTDRAAMDDAADAAHGRRLDDFRGSIRIHAPVDVDREAGLPVDRGNVIDDIHGFRGGDQRGPIAHVAGNELDAGRCECVRAAHRIAHQSTDRVAARGQLSRQMPTGKPGCARD
jgi:hypothetical protein